MKAQTQALINAIHALASMGHVLSLYDGSCGKERGSISTEQGTEMLFIIDPDGRVTFIQPGEVGEQEGDLVK